MYNTFAVDRLESHTQFLRNLAYISEKNSCTYLFNKNEIAKNNFTYKKYKVLS